MLRRLVNFLKRAELASDLMVLERIPDSPQAEKVRQKLALRSLERQIKNRIDQDAQRIMDKMEQDAQHFEEAAFKEEGREQPR